jgi:hypothetical protein
MVDLSKAPAYKQFTPWPSECENLPSDAFFEAMAGLCEPDRPDLAQRFLQFADEYRSPDAALRELAQHYPKLPLRALGRIIAGDLARFTSLRSPAASPENDLIREIIRLNKGRVLDFEAIRKKLAPSKG